MVLEASVRQVVPGRVPAGHQGASGAVLVVEPPQWEPPPIPARKGPDGILRAAGRPRVGLRLALIEGSFVA